MRNMIKRSLLALSMLMSVEVGAAIYNVVDYGAKGDSIAIDSYAINKAIETASQNGGGTIVVPAGKYLCYSIHLKSNITLDIENGAVIIAAYPTENEGYDVAEPNDDNPYQDFGHSHWKNSLIWAIREHDICIKGDGLIYGKGLSREESRLPHVGNKAIALKECYNVSMRDISMLRCGHFALLATGVDNLNIIGLRVDTNRDGFDIDCCRNVRVSNCSVNTPWDDAIVLKSSYGLGYFRDSENITVTDCYVSGYDQGSVMNATWQIDEPQAPDHGGNCGRVKIGTESSGGFKNIIISNCIFEHCRGVAIETVDGGIMEDVIVSNITMRDIVNAPIFLRLGSRQRSPKGTPVGAMRRVAINNISATNCNSEYSCLISGIPTAQIEDISINNVSIVFEGGYSVEDGNLVPPENENIYPEPWMFGRIPASGFYIRHANGVRISNVRLFYKKGDGRPLVKTNDVQNLSFENIWVDNKLVPNLK